MITSTIASRLRRLSSAWPGPMLHRATSNTKIPKQLRFVWGLLGGGEMPRQQRRYLSHARIASDWNLSIHDRQEITDLAAHYSGYPFASYPKDIQRCNVCRLMLLHRYGGVYSDLNVEPCRSLENLFARYPQASVILGVEVCLSPMEARCIGREMAIRQGVPEVRRRIANFFMASVPGHPFWLAALELARSRAMCRAEPIRHPVYNGAGHRHRNAPTECT